MQNAWRFVDDEVLRDRLKEAKGIGTPATRAEIIGGLKKQGFLIAQGKNIVPTATGLSLFGVLKQADPALVDPGVTAQLECVLDEVVIGKQEMVGAIDAVCDVAQRIIGKLQDGAAGEGLPLLCAAVNSDAGGGRPPTPAMKRFADSIARQKGIKPPAGYAKSGSVCRAFLDRHAPRKDQGEAPGEKNTKPPSPAQVSFAERIARERGIDVPDEAKASSVAVTSWIASNQSATRRSRSKTANADKPRKSTESKSMARKKMPRK
jgi:DNA topoisomerase-3